MTGPSVSTEDVRWRKLETSGVLLLLGVFVILLAAAAMHASDVLTVLMAAFCIAPWGPR